MQVVDVLEVSIPIWDKAMLAQIVMLVMVVFLLRKLSDNRNNYYFLKRFYLWNACIYMKIRIEVSGSTHGGNEAVCYIYICL